MHECNADGEFDDDDFNPDTEERRPEPIYDRSKFTDAIDYMQRHCDCNIGITWDTIDYYLDEYCMFTTKEEYIVRYIGFDGDVIDQTSVDEKSLELAHSLYKEFGHDIAKLHHVEFEKMN